jgi:pilus assembly protein CpaE
MVKPVSAIALREAVLPLLAANTTAERGAFEAGKEKRTASIIVTVGARGGVGATTTSVNLAWIAAHGFNKKIALVDLDLQFGNCALALDLEPGRGLKELLSGPERIDSVLINSALAAESDNLAVFSAEESLEDAADFDTSGALALLKELRQDYDHIFVDLPRSLVGRHRRIFSMADHVIVVSELTLASIRDTTRILSAIQGLGVTVPVHIVAGRVGQGEAQVSKSTFEHGVRSKIALVIPSDPNNIRLSANRGKALASFAPSCLASVRFKQLAASVIGENSEMQAVDASGGFLKRLFGK